jgi:hypothetical protein
MRRLNRWQRVLVVLGSGLVVGLVLLIVINPFGSVEIRVINDTGLDVGISSCVDDSTQVDAGDTFWVYGVPEGDRLMCWEYPSDTEIERCIAIPHVHEIQGTFPLSRALHRPKSDCESGWEI